jgi:hypothetical protein
VEEFVACTQHGVQQFWFAQSLESVAFNVPTAFELEYADERVCSLS